MGNWVKELLVFILIICILCFIPMPVYAAGYSAGNPLVIALDPGHGGEETGAEYYGLQEKDINLQMAELVKQELEQYEGVEVVLVRDHDEEVTLAERARRASEAGADILLSLHFNASVSHESNGASVYISTGESNKGKLQEFADYLLGEFEAIGLQNAGTFARVTQMGGRRADGSFDDYYGVLRHSYNYGIPSMIIEHCYMDSVVDKPFFYSSEGLEKLARADANGIAAFYQLKNTKGETVEPKHAAVFGATSRAVERNYYKAPNILSVRLEQYDGKTSGLAAYQIEVEDGVGISSIYLVYKHMETGEVVTVSMGINESLTTGSYSLDAYIPNGLTFGTYKLCYVGAYNEAGFDAGYNNSWGNMIGYGKCDWLNTFSYNGEADITVKEKGYIFSEHADKIMSRIKTDFKTKKRFPSLILHPGN